MEFEILLKEQQAYTATQDAAWEYQSRKRHARQAASERNKRMEKAIAVGLALAIPAAAVLTAPATGVAESTEPMDKLQRPALAEIPEEAENERIEVALLARAHKIENCTVTWYTADTCGKRINDPAYGITFSGFPVVNHLTCATDPDVIPTYSDVFVQYEDGTIEQLWATDTGVFGRSLDIYTDDYDYAIQCGRQALTVWFIPPEGRLTDD